MDADIQTEVPLVLKRLVRMIARCFYSMEHAIIVDMLVRHPCIKVGDACCCCRLLVAYIPATC